VYVHKGANQASIDGANRKDHNKRKQCSTQQPWLPAEKWPMKNVTIRMRVAGCVRFPKLLFIYLQNMA